MKKSKLIIIIILILLIISALCLGIYGYGMTKVSKESQKVEFIVKSGASKIEIVNQLKNAGLIRSKNALLVYLYFNKDLNLQAGNYELDRNMNPKEIIEKINKGDVLIKTMTIKFIEGKNMKNFINLVKEKRHLSEEEIKTTLNDKEFLNTLIEKYDFLTNEILNDNIYYALEGYLYPDTYEILENANLKDLIIKMLDNTKTKLSNLDLNNSKYSVHELLTMASIVELEGVNAEDRAKFAQVIYKRLELGMTLGMDTTAKYVAEMENKSVNYLAMSPYNTRRVDAGMAGKLPIGPIGNPSIEAINAVLHPSDTEYVYFVANTCTGENFFNVDLMEHSKKARELKSICATN